MATDGQRVFTAEARVADVQLCAVHEVEGGFCFFVDGHQCLSPTVAFMIAPARLRPDAAAVAHAAVRPGNV